MEWESCLTAFLCSLGWLTSFQQAARSVGLLLKNPGLLLNLLDLSSSNLLGKGIGRERWTNAASLLPKD